MKVTVYDTGHRTSNFVCRSFAQGCGAEVKPTEAHEGEDGAAFFYGILRGNMAVLNRCRLSGRPFLFCDNGYLGASQFDGTYRVTWNKRFHSGRGEPDYERLEALGVQLRPWRRTGRKILVCPPVPDYEWNWSFDGKLWLRSVQKRVRSASRRPIIVRWRDDDPRRPKDQPPLAEHLAEAWALVTHESNVAIRALIEGVPVFLTGEGAALAMGSADLRRIENPMYPDDRERWLGVLAANQWALDEFRDGTAARALGIMEAD